jgi:hypothetical protein
MQQLWMYLDTEMCLDTSIFMTYFMEWREYLKDQNVYNLKLFGFLGCFEFPFPPLHHILERLNMPREKNYLKLFLQIYVVKLIHYWSKVLLNVNIIFELIYRSYVCIVKFRRILTFRLYMLDKNNAPPFLNQGNNAQIRYILQLLRSSKKPWPIWSRPFCL